MLSTSKTTENDDLATDDGDGGKSFPKRREGVVVGAAVVAEHGAGLLDSIYQADQALHARHTVKMNNNNKKKKKVLATTEDSETLNFQRKREKLGGEVTERGITEGEKER